MWHPFEIYGSLRMYLFIVSPASIGVVDLLESPMLILLSTSHPTRQTCGINNIMVSRTQELILEVSEGLAACTGCKVLQIPPWSKGRVEI